MSDAALIVCLSGLAGALALDATAAFQFMISQPLVAGALAGALCGDAVAGTALGAVLQLVWLGSLPVGAAGFPDVPVGTVVGVGLAALLTRAGAGGPWPLALGLGTALVVGEIGRALVGRIRRMNVGLADRALESARASEPRGVQRAVGAALALRFAAGAALAAVVLTIGRLALVEMPWPEARGALPTFIWAAPVAAAVVALWARGMLERGLIAAGFLVGLFVVFVA